MAQKLIAHREYTDLMPFYAAGTLPIEQSARLNYHLNTCEACRLAYQDWQVIGAASFAQGASLAGRTPPITSEVRYQSTLGAGYSAPQSSTPNNASRRFDTPIGSVGSIGSARRRPVSLRGLSTVAAVGIVTLLTIGLLTQLSQIGKTPQDGNNGNLAAQPSLASTEKTATRFPVSATPLILGTPTLFIPTTAAQQGGEPTATIGLSPDMNMSPGVNPTRNKSPRPTATPTIVLPIPTMTALPDRCQVLRIEGNNAIPLYAQADTSSTFLGYFLMNEPVYTWIKFNGWYQLYTPTQGIIGWTSSLDLSLRGDACNQLMAPSPTYSFQPSVTPTVGPDQACVFQNNYSGVKMIYADNPTPLYLTSIPFGDSVTPLGYTTFGWYKVRYEVSGQTLIGWIDVEGMTSYGDCSTVPEVPAVVIPTPSPTATNDVPTFAPPTLTPTDTAQPPPITATPN